MNNFLRNSLFLMSLLSASSSVFAYTIVDTTQVPGFITTAKDGTEVGISQIVYSTPEEEAFLEQGGDISELDIAYIEGKNAVDYLMERGVISSSKHSISASDAQINPRYLEESIEQYYEYNANIYAGLKSTVKSQDGSKWTYSSISSTRPTIYNSDTYVSSKVTSGGTGSSTCKTSTVINNSTYGNYTISATFSASDF